MTLLFLLSFSKTYGQTNNCDTVYSFVEVMPKYNTDTKELLNYLMNELVPIIDKCSNRDSALITDLLITLIIDANGKVIDVSFQKNNLSLLCKEELKAKLLTMTGWTAGQKNGEPVCCKIIWPISCLKWND